MSFNKLIKNYWSIIEKKNVPPKYVSKLNELDFSILKKAIDRKDLDFIKKIIRKMYVHKEAFILKN